MTKPELHQFFIRNGWAMKPNSVSYYRPDRPAVRYKVGKLTLRKERQISSGEWYRVQSGYISKLTLNGEGKLVGMAF
jgi:hypothetical protein